MIQRKQTVFLFFALLALIVCLISPIGVFNPDAMGVSGFMYNFAVASQNGDVQMEWWKVLPLAVMLIVACLLTIWTIFAFKNRKRQARLCVWNMVLMLLWYALYAVDGLVFTPAKTTFMPYWAAALPLVAELLYLLARRGVMADERLVRSMDRIR